MMWRGRRVLVTGHTGFKGAWLSLMLARLEACVCGLALPPDSPSFYEQAGVASVLAGERLADIRRLPDVHAAFDAAQPEVVFHLAAQPLVRASYHDPLATLETNVLGLAHIMEAVRACSSVRAVVIVTSDKCYENRENDRPYQETDPLGGADPYSASKACAELVTASYRQSFLSSPEAARVATCRAGNVFGGGDWARDRLVPDIVRALLTRQPVYLRNPRSVRPWQHVFEPLRGYLMVAERLLQGDEAAASAWNFGPDPGAGVTVRQLAEAFLSAWGEGSIVEEMQPGLLHEAGQLRVDSSKAARLLRWRPLLDMPESLRLTVDWYRRVEQQPDSLAASSRRQIDDYLARWSPCS